MHASRSDKKVAGVCVRESDREREKERKREAEGGREGKG